MTRPYRNIQVGRIDVCSNRSYSEEKEIDLKIQQIFNF